MAEHRMRQESGGKRRLDAWLDDLVSREVPAGELAGALVACTRARHSQRFALGRRLKQLLDVGHHEHPQASHTLDALVASARATALLQRSLRAAAPETAEVRGLADAVARTTVAYLQRSPAQGWRFAAALTYLRPSCREDVGVALKLAAKSLIADARVLKPRDWTLALNGLARGEFNDSDGSLLRNTFISLQTVSFHDWTSMDVALLCNAIGKLRVLAGNDLFLEQWQHLLSRVAGHVEHLAPSCNIQDAAHFFSVFSSLPDRTLACSTCVTLVKLLPLPEMIEEASPEGLCAIITAFARLSLLDDDTAPIFRAVSHRARRGGLASPSFGPAHLSHIAHAFSLWLPGNAGDRSVMSQDALSPDEVVSVFETVLHPAISKAAPHFAVPKHVAFAAAALVRVEASSPGTMLAPLEALAERLLIGQRNGQDSLQFARFDGLSLSMLAGAYGQLDSLPNHSSDLLRTDSSYTSSMLKSLLSFLLDSSDRGGLDTLPIDSICRLAGAFAWVSSGLDVCQRAVRSALARSPDEALTVQQVSFLLSSMARLELRDGKIIGELLWHAHLRIWHEYGDPRHAEGDGVVRCVVPNVRNGCDLRSVGSIISALSRLGVFDTEGSTDASVEAALAAFVWASILSLDAKDHIPPPHLVVLLRNSSRLAAVSPLLADWSGMLVEHLAYRALHAHLPMALCHDVVVALGQFCVLPMPCLPITCLERVHVILRDIFINVDACMPKQRLQPNEAASMLIALAATSMDLPRLAGGLAAAVKDGAQKGNHLMSNAEMNHKGLQAFCALVALDAPRAGYGSILVQFAANAVEWLKIGCPSMIDAGNLAIASILCSEEVLPRKLRMAILNASLVFLASCSMPQRDSTPSELLEVALGCLHYGLAGDLASADALGIAALRGIALQTHHWMFLEHTLGTSQIYTNVSGSVSNVSIWLQISKALKPTQEAVCFVHPAQQCSWP